MCLRDYFVLHGIGSPFIHSEDFTPEDIAIFLWVLSPEFVPCKMARKDFFKKRAKKLNNIKIKFTGSVIRKKLNKIYSISHIIILPSFSEGFPKVIAEAGAYGCVPVVSNVGSLGQYINEGNGILLKKNTVSDVLNAIILLKNNRSLLKKMSLECNKSSNRFSYDNYIKSINQIIKKK